MRRRICSWRSLRRLHPSLHVEVHEIEGAGVDAVAGALGVSRRLLSLRYAEYEGKSIHDTLVERRLAEVMRLLKRPDFTITEITARSGFPNANYLKRLVKRRGPAGTQTFSGSQL